jgi:hypothetical protein
MLVMQSTDQWINAWASALPVWQGAVRQSGWHPMVAAAATAAIALLCLAAGRSARAAGHASVIWFMAVATLVLLALNTLFTFDLLVVGLMRGVARASGWYEARGEVQAVALVAIGTAGLATWGALRHRRVLAVPATRWLLTGLAVLAGLATLRAVSLHATDELLNTRLAGLTLGRLVDALGLGLMATGAWCELRDPCSARA